MKMSEAFKKAGVCSLPVDLTAAARNLGIKLVSYSSICRAYEYSMEELYRKSAYGFSFPEDGRIVIAVNENSCGERRRRFTIAHEIGHCISGDIVQGEGAADRFAADFCAPICVLREIGAKSAQEIYNLCGISRRAAEVRLEMMKRGAVEPDREEILEIFGNFCGRVKSAGR